MGFSVIRMSFNLSKSPVSLLASAESPLSGESFLFGLSSSLPFKLMRTPLVGWILGAVKVAVPGPFRLIEDPADEPAGGGHPPMGGGMGGMM